MPNVCATSVPDRYVGAVALRQPTTHQVTGLGALIGAASATARPTARPASATASPALPLKFADEPADTSEEWSAVLDEGGRTMFRKLRERQAEMSAAVVDVPRGAMFIKLMEEDNYSAKEAAVFAKACHPFLGQQPNSRPFEDVMRMACLAFGMQARNLEKDEAVELAIVQLHAYREMALNAGDRNYIGWFTNAIDLYYRDDEPEETVEPPPPIPSFPSPRRREPLRANRSTS